MSVMYKYRESIGHSMIGTDQVKILKRDLEGYLGVLLDFTPPYLDPASLTVSKPVLIYDLEIVEIKTTYPATQKLVVHFLMDGEKRSIVTTSNSDFHSLFQPHATNESAL